MIIRSLFAYWNHCFYFAPYLLQQVIFIDAFENWLSSFGTVRHSNVSDSEVTVNQDRYELYSFRVLIKYSCEFITDSINILHKTALIRWRGSGDAAYNTKDDNKFFHMRYCFVKYIAEYFLPDSRSF